MSLLNNEANSFSLATQKDRFVFTKLFSVRRLNVSWAQVFRYEEENTPQCNISQQTCSDCRLNAGSAFASLLDRGMSEFYVRY